MWRDLHYAFRQLRRYALHSIVVILLLSMGAAANAVILGFVDTLLLRPLPVRNPGNLYLFEKHATQQVRPDVGFVYKQYELAIARKDLFASVVAEEEPGPSGLVNCDTGIGAMLAMTQMVSPGYFEDLGIKPALGRPLSSDDLSSNQMGVVLSFQFWQSAFGGDIQILHKTIRLNKHPVVVVGVLPQEFHSIDRDRAPDIRLPISAAPLLRGGAVHGVADEQRLTFRLLARLAPTITPAQASSAISAGMISTEESSLYEWNSRKVRPLPQAELDHWLQRARASQLGLRAVPSGISQLRDQFSSALMTLLVAGVLLQLTVCACVAGLLLVKYEGMRHEVAVRRSVGASTLHLVRQILTGHALLVLLATLVAIAVCVPLSTAVLRALPPIRDFGQYASPQLLDSPLNLRIGFLLVGLMALSTIASAMFPLYRVLRPEFNSELRASTRSTSGGSTIAVLALQVALATIVLALSSLMLKTYQNLISLDPGFDRAHIATFTVDPRRASYTTTETGRYFQELRQRVASLPGVERVAYASRGLMRGTGIKATVSPQGRRLSKDEFLNTSVNVVTPDFFATMSIPLLAGRNWDAADRNKSPTPIIVNEAFGKAFFGSNSPLGRYLVNGADGMKAPDVVIVGVVGNAKYRSMREDNPPTTYSLLDESKGSDRALVMYVRTPREPKEVLGQVPRVMHELDPSVPLLESASIEDEVRNSLWQETLVALLTGCFAVFATILAGSGLYGAMSAAVARRRREFGIRLAVGASNWHLTIALSKPMLLALLIGISTGLGFSMILARLLASQLYRVATLDAQSLVGAGIIVLICAALATAPPLLRAANTDPVKELQEQ